MSWMVRSLPAVRPFEDVRYPLQISLLTFVAYWIGAESAFFVGTLSDKIFAPIWPPNIVLLAAFLLVRPRWWWICILSAFPAHVIAETRIGMPISQMLVAFATNIAIALVSAAAIKVLLGDQPWFNTFRKTATFVIIVGFACPALISFGGAFVPILGGGGIDHYWVFWLQWFASNALGILTLGPLALILVSEGSNSFWSLHAERQAEALLIATLLIIVCAVVFDETAGQYSTVFLPALLYLPLPLVVWSASRFGAKGASAATLIMATVLIWRALNGSSLFNAGAPETNVFALQVFLIGLAVPMLLLGSSIDQLRRAERKLRQDDERMAFVAATANVGLWQHKSTFDRFWATDNCRTMLGIQQPVRLTREAILDVVHPDDRQLVDNAMVVGIQSAEAPVEFRVVMPNGEMRWLLVRSAVSRDASGAVINTNGVFTDITARKTAEAETELQKRELAHLMRVSQVGALSGGLAHELTQPLTAILANAQAAQAMLSDEKYDLKDIAEVLDDIIAEDRRAGEVIQRLRTLLKNGKGEIEPVDINDLVKSTLRLLNSEMIGRNIKPKIMLENNLPPIEGDSVQLQQVLLNLITNSLDAMSQTDSRRRVLTFTSQRFNKDEIEVSVIDRGVGIQSDEGRLFDAFFTTREQGLGLGLSICSTIIKRHGGSLSLANNPDGGAIARFRLPLQRVKGG